jgi:hypothetical protein
MAAMRIRSRHLRPEGRGVGFDQFDRIPGAMDLVEFEAALSITEGELDPLSSADRRQGAMEQPGSKHSISENASTPDPASLLAAVVADDDAKLSAFGNSSIALSEPACALAATVASRHSELHDRVCSWGIGCRMLFFAGFLRRVHWTEARGAADLAFCRPH